MDVKNENIMRIDSRLEQLWNDGVIEGERKGTSKSEWVLLYFYANETLQCDKCSTYIQHQKVHMYVNVEHEIEDILCEKCWAKEEEK